MKRTCILMAVLIGLPALFLSQNVPPKKSTGRMYAQEQAAIRIMMTINTAEAQYHSQSHRWAASLAELGLKNLIPADLVAGDAGGYKFAVTSASNGYAVTAMPTTFGTTGARTFYSDQSLVVRENYGPQAATAASPVVGSAWYKKNQER